MDGKFPKAIIFDLDDTILDYSGGAEECWWRLCGKYSVALGNISPEKLNDALTSVRNWYWDDKERHRVGRLNLAGARREIVFMTFEKLNLNNPGLANEMADSYSEQRERDMNLLPGAMETILALKNEKVRLAMITNGNALIQRDKVRRFKLEELFHPIVIEGEFGTGKPDEKVYLHVLNELGLSAGDCWMVGDNIVWDVENPQKLGIKGIWVDKEGKGLQKSSVRPDRIIRSISELISC